MVNHGYLLLAIHVWWMASNVLNLVNKCCLLEAAVIDFNDKQVEKVKKTAGSLNIDRSRHHVFCLSCSMFNAQAFLVQSCIEPAFDALRGCLASRSPRTSWFSVDTPGLPCY